MLELTQLTCGTRTFTLQPPLRLPVRPHGYQVRVADPALGLHVIASTPDALLDAVNDALLRLWYRYCAADRDSIELHNWHHIVALRDRIIPAIPEPAALSLTHCRPGCQGGNGCNHRRTA